MKHIIEICIGIILALFGFIGIASILWANLFDNTPAFNIIDGHVISIDKQKQLMIVEWHATRNRYCAVQRKGYIQEGGKTGPITPVNEWDPPTNGFENEGPTPVKGQYLVFQTKTNLGSVTQDFSYNVEFHSECDWFQKLSPIIQKVPPIQVKYDE